MNKRQSKKARRYKAIRALENLLKHKNRMIANVDGKYLFIADCEDGISITTKTYGYAGIEEISQKLDADLKGCYFITIKGYLQKEGEI